MNSDFSLSVVMSLFFKEKPAYLDLSLKSLYNQTLKADEIILVQEGELTAEHHSVLNFWFEKFGTDVLKLIKASNEKGLAECLNLGILNAKSNYIARFDSDDECLPDRFEKQINYLKSNPDVVLLGAQIEEVDENFENSLGIRRVPTTCEEIYKFSQWRSPFNHQTVIYKKDVVKQLGMYPTFVNNEDYGLWGLFIVNKYEVANLNDVVAKARTGKNLIKRRSGIKFLKGELKGMNFLYKIKFYSLPMYSLVVSSKILVRLLPSFMLEVVYKFLRRAS